MKFLVFVFSVLLACDAGARPLDVILKKADLWALTPDTFGRAQEAVDFAWTSNARDSARAAQRDLTLLGLPVVEAVARFDGEKMKEISFSMYARGDVGELPKEQFEAFLTRTVEALNVHTAKKFTVRGKDPTNAVKAEGLIWQTDGARYLLEYSVTRKSRDIPYRAEFIRLRVTSPERSVGLLASAANLSRVTFSATARVQRDTKSGDVSLRDVPMVDQGEKGYCAVACAERVLRYYGTATDANELAQVANSDASGGTSYDGMVGALKKLAGRLKVRIRPVEQLEVKDWMDLISDYNRATKRGTRAPEIPSPSMMIDVNAIMSSMKPELLREVRTKNKSDLSRFQKAVQSHVDQGIPVIWGVMLGIFPEPGVPQSGGGHMRLIIGYNTKTDEVLFSDSWGPGHELKRMPMADAWTITTGMLSIQPI